MGRYLGKSQGLQIALTASLQWHTRITRTTQGFYLLQIRSYLEEAWLAGESGTDEVGVP